MSDSEPFDRMARAIEHNKAAGFGGAAVIVIPGQPEQIIEMLILDPRQNVAQFIGAVATRIQMIQNELEQKQRMLQGFSR